MFSLSWLIAVTLSLLITSPRPLSFALILFQLSLAPRPRAQLACLENQTATVRMSVMEIFNILFLFHRRQGNTHTKVQ